MGNLIKESLLINLEKETHRERLNAVYVDDVVHEAIKKLDNKKIEQPMFAIQVF
jgi:hypothetical protein